MLGIALTWSHGVAYSYYEHVPRIWGLSAINDQNVGGAIMMVEQSLVLVDRVRHPVRAYAAPVRGGRAPPGALRGRRQNRLRRTMKLTLYRVPGSHPSDAVEAALKLKGLEYKRVDLLPVIHKAVMRRRSLPRRHRALGL